MKRMVAFMILLTFVIVLLSSCSGGSQGIGEIGISAEEYDSLRLGMTKEKVTEIVGGEGGLISESKEDNDEYLITVFLYRYKGEISGYADLEFTLKTHKGYTTYNFQTFSLTGKTKYDLK